MCAGSNPPFVFTIFRFAAYLNLVQDLWVLFGFAPCGSSFSFLLWKSQVLPSLCMPYWIIFCSVANHLWLSISRSHFLYGGRSFLCRSSVSCSSSHDDYVRLFDLSITFQVLCLLWTKFRILFSTFFYFSNLWCVWF